jgi:hypothetical protein
MGELDYIVIARGNTVIASYGDRSLVGERHIRKLFPKGAGTTDQKIRRDKLLSFVTTPGYVFAAVSTQTTDRQRSLARLEALSLRWIAQFLELSRDATSHSLDSLFEDNSTSVLRNPPSSLNEPIEIGGGRDRNRATETLLNRRKPGKPSASACACSLVSWSITSVLIILIVGLLKLMYVCGIRFQKCMGSNS